MYISIFLAFLCVQAIFKCNCGGGYGFYCTIFLYILQSNDKKPEVMISNGSLHPLLMRRVAANYKVKNQLINFALGRGGSCWFLPYYGKNQPGGANTFMD